jgi:hypothetical protein
LLVGTENRAATSHSLYWLQSKRQIITSVDKVETVTLKTAGGNIKEITPTGKQFGSLLKC